MNSIQLALRVAGTIFGVVCLAHLARLLLKLPVIIGGYHLPVWISGGGFIIAGLLALWLWQLSLPPAEDVPHAPAAG